MDTQLFDELQRRLAEDPEFGLADALKEHPTLTPNQAAELACVEWRCRFPDLDRDDAVARFSHLPSEYQHEIAERFSVVSFLQSRSVWELAADVDEQDLTEFELPGSAEIIGEIGRGGMGVVYKVRDDAGHFYALKMCQSGGGKLRNEALLLSRLTHEYIVTLRFAGRDPQTGRFYFLMDYVDGETLAERRYDVQTQLNELLELFARIARAMAFANSRGLLHCDLKPANIMVDHEGNPRVLDYGLARMVQDVTPRKGGGWFGTPGYMPPEQAQGVATQNSDVYSLAATFFDVLVGTPPDGSTEEALSELCAHLPKTGTARHLARVLCRCLQTDPEARPGMSDFRDALDDLQMGRPPRLLRRARLLWSLIHPSTAALAIVFLAAQLLVFVVLFFLGPDLPVSPPDDVAVSPESIDEIRPWPPGTDWTFDESFDGTSQSVSPIPWEGDPPYPAESWCAGVGWLKGAGESYSALDLLWKDPAAGVSLHVVFGERPRSLISGRPLFYEFRISEDRLQLLDWTETVLAGVPLSRPRAAPLSVRIAFGQEIRVEVDGTTLVHARPDIFLPVRPRWGAFVRGGSATVQALSMHRHIPTGEASIDGVLDAIIAGKELMERVTELHGKRRLDRSEGAELAESRALLELRENLSASIESHELAEEGEAANRNVLLSAVSFDPELSSGSRIFPSLTSLDELKKELELAAPSRWRALAAGVLSLELALTGHTPEADAVLALAHSMDVDPAVLARSAVVRLGFESGLRRRFPEKVWHSAPAEFQKELEGRFPQESLVGTLVRPALLRYARAVNFRNQAFLSLLRRASYNDARHYLDEAIQLQPEGLLRLYCSIEKAATWRREAMRFWPGEDAQRETLLATAEESLAKCEATLRGVTDAKSLESTFLAIARRAAEYVAAARFERNIPPPGLEKFLRATNAEAFVSAVKPILDRVRDESDLIVDRRTYYNALLLTVAIDPLARGRDAFEQSPSAVLRRVLYPEEILVPWSRIVYQSIHSEIYAEDFISLADSARHSESLGPLVFGWSYDLFIGAEPIREVFVHALNRPRVRELHRWHGLGLYGPWSIRVRLPSELFAAAIQVWIGGPNAKDEQEADELRYWTRITGLRATKVPLHTLLGFPAYIADELPTKPSQDGEELQIVAGLVRRLDNILPDHLRGMLFYLKGRRFEYLGRTTLARRLLELSLEASTGLPSHKALDQVRARTRAALERLPPH